MNGIRVRIAVSSLYTPSVRMFVVAEKHLTPHRCIGRRAAPTRPASRGIEEYGFAMSRSMAWKVLC